jgi:hypothetical protein
MRTSTFAILVLSTAASVSAHEGPRFWLGSSAGRVVAFTSDNDFDPTQYAPSRLFTAQFEEFFGVFTTVFPGFEVRQTGGNVANGTTFTFNIAGPALYYDEQAQAFVTTAQMFGPPAPGPVPQLAVSLGSNIRSTSTGPVSGFAFFTFNAPGDHSHLAYTLLGDGVTASDGPPGVYALQLNLTAGGLAASDTFYLLIGKDVEYADPLFEAAVARARASLVGMTLSDLPEFEACLAGPQSAPPFGCAPFDFDNDGDVDLVDFAAAQRIM